MLQHLCCAERSLTIFFSERPESSVGFGGNDVEEIHAVHRGRLRSLKRHFRSFHQLYVMTKFNSLPSLLRPSAD